MKPALASDRILAALQLQPMTVEQLVTCLSLYQGTVRKRVLSMREERRIRVVRAMPSQRGRPWAVYSITGLCHAQKTTGGAS